MAAMNKTNHVFQFTREALMCYRVTYCTGPTDQSQASSVTYRRAENFRGRNFRGLVKKHNTKLSWIARLSRAKGHHVPNFAEKTFANSHKTVKFAKVFSLKFPAIRYAR